MKDVVKEGKFNEVLVIEERRPDGSLRVAYDYEFCPSSTDQTQAHMSDLNYLIAKFKPDELAAYMAARNSYRQEILGHDFSMEPELADAKAIVNAARGVMQMLPLEVLRQFNSPLDFLRYLDNPQNQEALIKAGILTRKDMQPVVGSNGSSSVGSSGTTPPVPGGSA